LLRPDLAELLMRQLGDMEDEVVVASEDLTAPSVSSD
jgi:hypothetical protein